MAMRNMYRVLGLSVAAALFLGLASACLGDRVTFDSLELYPGASATPPGRVRGYLTLPDREGPHPAAILLHGCSGLLGKHTRWAGLLASWGIASLRVDSFSPRGIAEICTDIRRHVPRAEDVKGALAWLRERDDIDAARVAVVGWSHGAGTALRVASEPGPLGVETPQGLRAVVAFYPWCQRRHTRFGAPVLLLIGDADDWTPSGLCEHMVEHLPPASRPVDLVVYEGATHSYDCTTCDLTYLGHRLVFDRAAYRDSKRRVRVFLEEALEIR